MLVTEINHKLL